MYRRISVAIAAVFVVVLVSCSDSGLLTPLRDQSSQITISSVESGTMVTSGDQIPLSVKLNSSQSTPTDLKVELLSTAGSVVQTADIKNVDFSAPLPSVELSNLPDGSYTMQLTLSGADNAVLAQQKVSLFYVQGGYSLDGITSYPPTLQPGASGLIVARVTAPTGSNPYLRWSMGDKLIATGYLNDGYDKIQWNAPASTGVYSITVELFPFGPPPGGSFNFTSPYKMKVEVFVTTSTKATRNQLGPKDSYFALFHFQGDLKDAGGGSQGLTLTPIGNPTLAVVGSVFGYQLDGSSGFRADSLLLPVDSEGALQPASITMRIRLDKEEANRQFFQTTTRDGSFSLVLGTDAKGLLSASVNGVSESEGVQVTSGDTATVTLSIVPSSESLDLLWFVNGDLEVSDSLAVSPRIDSTSGVSSIAGANGFTGLIDEFGVYYKDLVGNDSTDPEVYRRAMSDEYGSNLIFAEGFDGIYLPSDLTYAGDVRRSQLSGGLLSLSQGQSVTLPPITLGEESLTLTSVVSGLSDTTAGMLFLSEKGVRLYTVPLKNALNSAGQLELVLKKVDGGLSVTAGAQNTATIQGDIPTIDVGIASTGKVPFALRGFLIVTSRASLAKKKASAPTVPET